MGEEREGTVAVYLAHKASSLWFGILVVLRCSQELGLLTTPPISQPPTSQPSSVFPAPMACHLPVLWLLLFLLDTQSRNKRFLVLRVDHIYIYILYLCTRAVNITRNDSPAPESLARSSVVGAAGRGHGQAMVRGEGRAGREEGGARTQVEMEVRPMGMNQSPQILE